MVRVRAFAEELEASLGRTERHNSKHDAEVGLRVLSKITVFELRLIWKHPKSVSGQD